MPKLLVIDPNPKSAVSFYRSLGPFSYLYKIDPSVQYETPTVINWNTLTGNEILYIQRPFAEDHITALREAKKIGMKTWLDLDDLLHEIPKYNPYHKAFELPTSQIRNVFERAIKMVDIVTVTTQELKDYYFSFNNNIEIVENAHNDYAFPFKRFIGGEKPIINWRGSETHRMDILSVAQQIVSISKQYPDWSWVFMGNNLWYITEIIKGKVAEIPEKPILDYFEIMANMGAAIQIVPLIDNRFNRAKSAIAFYEGTYGGMVTIAPDFPEFNEPGCLCYKDAEQFGYLLEKCIKSKSFRKENYEKAFEYIKNNLLLSKINKKRIDIIYRLIEK